MITEEIKEQIALQEYSLPYAFLTSDQERGLIDRLIIAAYAKGLSDAKDNPKENYNQKYSLDFIFGSKEQRESDLDFLNNQNNKL